MPSIGTHPNVRPTPKPPNAEDATSSPNLGHDPMWILRRIHPMRKELLQRHM